MINNLWFVEQDMTKTLYRASVQNTNSAFISAVNSSTLHHLWHHRLGHPGKTITDNVHKSCDGVPRLTLRNPFHHCDACSHGKMTKMIKDHQHEKHKATCAGERFQLDFGFVCGSCVRESSTPDTLITSIDGNNAYLLITDGFTRHMWIFTTRWKDPPITIVDNFLDKYGLKEGNRYIRTYRGGELAGSHAFQSLVASNKYVLESTAPDSSFQIGIVERGHRTLSNMMRSMLKGVSMESEYWSYAIRHAIYIRNHLPHTSLPDPTIPYQRFHGRKPDLCHLRVFGSSVTVKTPGVKHTKLDNRNTTSGIFLGFTATDRNIIFEDYITKEIKTVTHAIFDEAHYSNDFCPPYA